MSKQIGSIASEFIERLKNEQIEREAKEKAEWDALSETEKQNILAERERQQRELEVEELKRQREEQIKKWKRQGVTKRYFDSEWDNWIADTPEKEIALKTAKTAWETNLFFTGSNGTGKTHLAMCLAKDGATYRRLSDIFREVRDGYNKGFLHIPSANYARTEIESESEILDYYGERKLLIIDEIGRQKFSDFELNLFFEIIDRRWNNVLPTTIITNLTADEFSDLYSMAILDRLRPIKVSFNWESARGKEL
jgi:DNA replication protein DnaC